jgi:hypothetical protein
MYTAAVFLFGVVVGAALTALFAKHITKRVARTTVEDFRPFNNAGMYGRRDPGHYWIDGPKPN